jgi:2-dehydro-3-deoxyphosphogalactonate aldolase
MQLDEALADVPVVAILRGVRPEEILDQAEALYATGVRAVEVPLNSPDPFESLRRLSAAFASRVACGAGTVLTPEAVEGVAKAGGTVVIAPNTRPRVIARALELVSTRSPASRPRPKRWPRPAPGRAG